MSVVWEPVIASDIGPPTPQVQRPLVDPRAAHWWDPEKVLSARMLSDARTSETPWVEGELPEVVWDFVALFPPDVTWGSSFPKPAFKGYPVVEAIRELRPLVEALSR